MCGRSKRISVWELQLQKGSLLEKIHKLWRTFLLRLGISISCLVSCLDLLWYVLDWRRGRHTWHHEMMTRPPLLFPNFLLLLLSHIVSSQLLSLILSTIHFATSIFVTPCLANSETLAETDDISLQQRLLLLPMPIDHLFEDLVPLLQNSIEPLIAHPTRAALAAQALSSIPRQQTLSFRPQVVQQMTRSGVLIVRPRWLSRGFKSCWYGW